MTTVATPSPFEPRVPAAAGSTSPLVPLTADASRRLRFDTCLRRCAAARLRLIVTTPSDVRVFSRGVSRFPDRRIDPSAHVQWETDYRVFCGRGRLPHDRGSWRILAVDADDRVVGAITARFFCGEIVNEYLHVCSLLDLLPAEFREHCELSIAEMLSRSLEAGRTPAEVSHCAVEPGRHAGLVAATLVRAMGALAAAFDSPLILIAADHRRGEVARLMRFGGAPLGRAGGYSLPPFVHSHSGAWLRLLLVDAPSYYLRARSTPAADLVLLRQHAVLLSPA